MRLAPHQLATLVSSRLCHDLVSPIGAIGNGIELLELSGDFPGLTQAPEMRLIADSVSAAHNRLQLYRIAFGPASADQTVTAAELKKLLAGITVQRRIQADLVACGTFPRDQVRMVLLSLLCLEHALPRGGRINVVNSESGWKLTAETEQIREDCELWAWLGQSEAVAQRNPAPSEIQFALLADAAKAAGREVSWTLDQASAQIAF